ncbi:hypothetical protein [Lacinutrix jangbogonensis]|uniref:hypothetical protein n=1 Tax=Lacinutrix jangbogonensis TaxID=1469557 RepID=UPI00053DB41E|nr:hypothetical protein [Lacinutrix jangbogonensis]
MKLEKKNEIILSADELLFLKFHVFGFTDKYIFDLLQMSRREVTDLKYFLFKRLKSAFAVKTNLECVKKAFETGVLDSLDFLNEDKKAEVDILTKNICEMSFLEMMATNDKHENLETKILSILGITTKENNSSTISVA